MLIPNDALSYECWAPRQLYEKVEEAELVFTGEVGSIEEVGTNEGELGSVRHNILFKIERIWKGLDEADHEVYADVESAYEYNFEVGKTYLVFAYNIYKDRVSMVGCPRVREVSDITRDIRQLGEPMFTIRLPAGEDALNRIIEGEGEFVEEGEETTEESVVEEELIEETSEDTVPPIWSPKTQEDYIVETEESVDDENIDKVFMQNIKEDLDEIEILWDDDVDEEEFELFIEEGEEKLPDLPELLGLPEPLALPE